MKQGDAARLPLALYEILNTNSDENHVLSMPEIQAQLEEYNLKADRRTIYTHLQAMPDFGIDIQYVRKGKQGYYLKHPFSLGEAFVLLDAIGNASLSKNEKKQLTNAITSQLSSNDSRFLQKQMQKQNSEISTDTIGNMQTIFTAIQQSQTISFRYFDLSLTKEKKYRKDRARYELDPYAIVSDQGRYYCIVYSNTHNNFASYRIDKMDHLLIRETTFIPKPFQLDAYMRSSYHMYHGEPTTISLSIDNDLLNVFFDEFGSQMIISKVGKKTFEAHIKASISPTQTSWLLQFIDRIHILQPKQLIDDILTMSEHIQKEYGGKRHE